MRKYAFLALLAALLTAAWMPTAFAAQGVTPANGNDVVFSDGSVYQGNDDGTWSWIPDVATGKAMGLDWSSLQPVDVLPGPIGAPFASVSLSNASVSRTSSTSSTPAAKANGNDVILPDNSIYQQNADGSYSWIPDVPTANAMGLNWNNLLQVDELDGPVAAPFPHITK